MLEKFFLYIQGYLILELCGDEKERFINLCKNKGIEILQLYLIEETWYCKIRSKDFKKMKCFTKKTGCFCKIKRKIGFPFFLRGLKKRKGIVIGSILFFLVLQQCSGRIWHISVEGGFLHTREQMLQVMQTELGVYGGVLSEQVDCFEVEKRLRLDYNEIGWISVEKKGCCLFVRLNESTMPEEAEKREVPSHIVADRDGIVRKLEVRKGVPMVKTGDRVKKGDILISGIVSIVGDFDELLRKEPVVALGNVYLESDFSYEANFPITYEVKNYQKERLGLEIFLMERKIFSYMPRYSDGKYDIISIDIVPYAFEDYRGPVLFRKYRLLPYSTEWVNMTEPEVKQKAENLWNAFLADWEKQGVQILDAACSTKIMQKKCNISGIITACGNFISYQEIMEEEWKTEHEYSGDNP